MGKGFYGEKNKKVHAGLHKLFTKTWNWRINFYYTYKWFVEHISSLMREIYVFFSPEKLQLSALFFGFGNSATIQWLIWVFSQSVILLVNCLSQPLSLFTCAIYSSEVTGINKVTVGDLRTRSFPTSLLQCQYFQLHCDQLWLLVIMLSSEYLSKEWASLTQFSSKCGPRTSSFIILWKSVRDAKFLASTGIYWIRNAGALQRIFVFA